jgi:hypothetical protein
MARPRRHKDVTGAPLCKQKLGKRGALHLEDDWHAVDCEVCHTHRFLHARREHEKRLAREAARVPVPLLEETIMDDPHVAHVLPCPDCPPPLAPEEFLRPGEITYRERADEPTATPTPCTYERLLHRMEGLEALLVSMSQRLDLLGKESAAREGYIQRQLTAALGQLASFMPTEFEEVRVGSGRAFGHAHAFTVLQPRPKA